MEQVLEDVKEYVGDKKKKKTKKREPQQNYDENTPVCLNEFGEMEYCASILYNSAVAEPVDVAEETIISMTYFLENFEAFKPKLLISAVNIWFDKFNIYMDKLKEIKSRDITKYKKVTEEWAQDLKRLGEFDNSQLWDVLREHYPDYFVTNKSMKNLNYIKDLIKKYVEEKDDKFVSSKIGRDLVNLRTTDDINTFASRRRTRSSPPKEISEATSPLINHLRSNIDKLPKIISSAMKDTAGREKEFDMIATMLISFSVDHQYPLKNYLNFLLVGGAGIGKTTFAEVIGKIFSHAGMLITDKFIVASRSDFVGQYLGQSAPKTIAKLESARESVLFIDEAYELARCDKFDGNVCKTYESYSSESMSALVQWMSENRGSIVIIAAGYEKDMLENFMVINQGIPRRFQNPIVLGTMTSQTLMDVFLANKAGVSDEAIEIVRDFVTRDKPVFQETLFTKPPLNIFRRQILTYEASDMVALATAVKEYKNSHLSGSDVGLKDLTAEQMKFVINKFAFKRAGVVVF